MAKIQYFSDEDVQSAAKLNIISPREPFEDAVRNSQDQVLVRLLKLEVTAKFH